MVSSLVASLVDRAGYPTLLECAYLNQASLGLIGHRAVETMHSLLDGVARHGNLHLSDQDEADFLAGLRTQAANLLSVDDHQVAIVASASELLSQAPFLLSPPVGSRVLLVSTDFPAITRPWLRLAERGDCVVDFVADDPDSDLTSDVIDRIGTDTSVVAIGLVQYATGTVIDVSRLREATAQVGARLVLDVTQGAGAIPIRTGTWRPDVLVSSGYKWLGGHGGVAIGVLADDLVSQTPPLPGWFGAADPFEFDATRLSIAPDARRFTQSTMSYISVAGLTVAIEELLTTGVSEVEQHASRLADLLVRTVEPSGWHPYRSPKDPASSPHIIALVRPEGSAARTVERLRRQGIVCSSRGDRLRVSLALYNDHTDIEALANGLG